MLGESVSRIGEWVGREKASAVGDIPGCLLRGGGFGDKDEL